MRLFGGCCSGAGLPFIRPVTAPRCVCRVCNLVQACGYRAIHRAQTTQFFSISIEFIQNFEFIIIFGIFKYEYIFKGNIFEFSKFRLLFLKIVVLW